MSSKATADQVKAILKDNPDMGFHDAKRLAEKSAVLHDERVLALVELVEEYKASRDIEDPARYRCEKALTSYRESVKK